MELCVRYSKKTFRSVCRDDTKTLCGIRIGLTALESKRILQIMKKHLLNINYQKNGSIILRAVYFPYPFDIMDCI